MLDIKFLSDEDFENQPIIDTLGENVSDSMAFYNPYTGVVRVRDTGFWDVNKYLLEHELEHAVEEHATDVGPQGLRHKKKRGFAKFITQALSFSSPISNAFSNVREADPPVGSLGQAFWPKSESQEQPQQQQQQTNPFGSSYSFPGAQTMTAAPSSPIDGQQNQMGGLNQGLNSQSVNPLSDPYANYGRPAGRMYF